MSSVWESLAKRNQHRSNICSMNGKQIITLTNEFGVQKYDSVRNIWKTIIEFPQSEYHAYYSLTLNEETNTLYLCTQNLGVMHFLDLSMNVRIAPLTDNTMARYPYFIVAEGELHSIGGAENNIHSVYNPDKHKFEPRHEIKGWDPNDIASDHRGNFCGGLVHIKSRRELLLFGGKRDIHFRIKHGNC